jgi:molecular chaperone DnaK (HSP70)
VIAFYIIKLKEFYESADYSVKDLVISIPSYASNVERQALLDAVDIAGLKTAKIINESTAIALAYGFFKRADIGEEKRARNVAFVDFGHSKTTITIASFTNQRVKIISHHSERNLGARDFDYTLMKKFSQEFDKKYGADPMESPRCRLRMMDAIEKARIILSADKEATINIDYLLDEQDMVR